MYQYLTSENIYTRFEASKQYTDSLTTPFPEYHRIANNKAKANKPKHLPGNTDGTTASIIHKTPRRVVQQVPSGTCSTRIDWMDIVSTFILFNEIVPNANSQYEFIEKLWQSEEGKLTRGSSPIYCPIVHDGEYIGPDWINPWWGDIFIQPGKLSDSDSKYIFLRSWWREEDIEALIDKVGKMDKEDAELSGWDVSILKNIKDHEQTKDDKAMTPTDRAQAVNQRGGIELITGFQVGVKSKFLTFHRETHSIARTKTNKDPRGKMPVNFNYAETNGTNPFGRGFVELVMPLQNLMDSDDQMYQFNRALMLAPPVIKRGNWSKSQAQLIPNAIWDLGTNPQNSAETLKIDSTALANYPEIYSLNQSRLFQLLSAPSSTVSQTAGNNMFSKTSAGVKQQDANLSVDDNFIRKKFESAFQVWAETAINLWFAERAGKQELQLDDETAEKLRNCKDFDEQTLSDDNKIVINYDSETDPITFAVDASSSRKEDAQQQVQTITGLLSTLENTPVLQSIVPPQKLKDAWNAIVVASGIENPEILKISDDELAQHQQEQAQQQQQAQQAAQQASAPAPAEPAPADYDTIYKDPTTPNDVKIQILEKSGLTVSDQDKQELLNTDTTSHMVTQMGNLSQVADHIQPPVDPNAAGNPQDPTSGSPESQQGSDNAGNPDAETPTDQAAEPQGEPAPAADGQAPSPQFDQHDHAFIEQLKQAGIPDEKIGSALALVHSGHAAEDVVNHILQEQQA